MISPLCRYRVSVIVPTVYYVCVGPLRVVQWGFKLPVIRIAPSARGVAHHNRESVGAVADTTLRFLSSVSPCC